MPYLLDVDDLGSAYYRDGQELLRDWDFRQPADSAAAAYYNVVWSNLLRLTFHDELRESLWPDGGDRWFAVMERLLRRPDATPGGTTARPRTWSRPATTSCARRCATPATS